MSARSRDGDKSARREGRSARQPSGCACTSSGRLDTTVRVGGARRSASAAHAVGPVVDRVARSLAATDAGRRSKWGGIRGLAHS